MVAEQKESNICFWLRPIIDYSRRRHKPIMNNISVNNYIGSSMLNYVHWSV